jgi:hypothetical protein
METMRQTARRIAARPTTVEAENRRVLCSASQSPASAVALDLASGMNYSSGVLVSVADEVFVLVETECSRCVLLIDPAEEAFVRELCLHGWFTLIVEGQIPVTVALPFGDTAAIIAYGRSRGWR